MASFKVTTFDSNGNERTSHDYDSIREACEAAKDDSEGPYTSIVLWRASIIRLYINGSQKLVD